MNSVHPAGRGAASASGTDLQQRDFAALPDLIRAHAAARPAHIALWLQDACLSYAELGELVDRAAAALQRCGLQAGAVAAFCANSSFEYVAAFLGCLRAGMVPAPLPL